ncbi:hypothetical protein IE53DRAFT_378448 [Violaceomyces palustris]|uniref:Uncharacterized protein n=1 Tax=Violaceomyces palustris TaxID=1673888 RepID=A0ACD0P1M6_9BASI|nr:hypothetical protein IE53DRAFT_378448 [Violaceomyces palustris]
MTLDGSESNAVMSSSSSSTASQRLNPQGQKHQGRGMNHDLLSRFDDLDEPLDTQDQDKIIEDLRKANQSSNYFYRAMIVVLMVLVFILYLTPIPDYVRGTHPENHITLFLHPIHHQGTHEDLTYLPALPFYLLFFFYSSYLLYLGTAETLYQMGHPILAPQRAKLSFPRQPHQFGTAPDWLVPALTDLRWGSSNKVTDGQRADKDVVNPRVASTVNPKLLYLFIIWVASWPLPLMTFGAGAFVNSLWWLATSGVLGVLWASEYWIVKTETELVGLGGMKYNHKGA